MRLGTRHRNALAVAVFAVAAILVLNGALWWLYRDVQRGLEAELARRLTSLVRLVAWSLEEVEQVQPTLARVAELHARLAEQPDSLEAARFDFEVIRLQSHLGSILDAINVVSIALYDSTGRRFWDGTDWSRNPDDPRVATELRAILDRQATPDTPLGRAAIHTPLYPSRDQLLMTALARVEDLRGHPFAVAVEADAMFFTGLRRLRNSLRAIAALSITLLAVLAFFFAGLQGRLLRAEAAARRAETLASMGQMVAVLAHEIRNPLNVIRATASRLKKRYDDPEAHDERFDFIEEEVDRLDGILHGYLDFARGQTPRLEPLDLTPTLQRTLRLLEPEWTTHGVVLHSELPDSCPVLADAPSMHQLVLNLVRNAIQAMPKGGRIDLRLEVHGDRARLSVCDQGPGFPRSVLQRPFEPFATTREKGSGLGLYFVQRIVEQHHGRVRLRNRPGGGACVDIELPLAGG